jgi:hypothetical protein
MMAPFWNKESRENLFSIAVVIAAAAVPVAATIRKFTRGKRSAR